MAQQLRTRRFETRLDPTTDDMITRAADALEESRSSFVVRAAKKAAEQVLQPADPITVDQALEVLFQNSSEADIAICPLLKALRGFPKST